LGKWNVGGGKKEKEGKAANLENLKRNYYYVIGNKKHGAAIKGIQHTVRPEAGRMKKGKRKTEDKAINTQGGKTFADRGGRRTF